MIRYGVSECVFWSLWCWLSRLENKNKQITVIRGDAIRRGHTHTYASTA